MTTSQPTDKESTDGASPSDGENTDTNAEKQKQTSETLADTLAALPACETTDTDCEYRCPVCEETYGNEMLARIHLTRVEDKDHKPHNGLMPEAKIEAIDATGDCVTTLSRHPSDLEPTALTLEDLPDHLSAMNKHVVLVAAHNPELTKKTEIATLVEDRLESKEIDVPAYRSVCSILNRFYRPHKTNSYYEDKTLADLTNKQQAVLLARLASPEKQYNEIAEMVGVADSYPVKVFDQAKHIMDELKAKQSDHDDIAGLIQSELPDSAIVALIEEGLLDKVSVNTEALKPISGDEPTEGTNLEPDNRPYDPSRWGSPAEHSTSLQAEPDSPLETGDSVEATPPQETQTDGGSGEFKPVKINRESAADEETEAEAKTDRSEGIPPEEIKKLKRSVGFVRETIEKAEKDEDEYARSIALQVEQRCYQLLQSEF